MFAQDRCRSRGAIILRSLPNEACYSKAGWSPIGATTVLHTGALESQASGPSRPPTGTEDWHLCGETLCIRSAPRRLPKMHATDKQCRIHSRLFYFFHSFLRFEPFVRIAVGVYIALCDRLLPATSYVQAVRQRVKHTIREMECTLYLLVFSICPCIVANFNSKETDGA